MWEVNANGETMNFDNTGVLCTKRNETRQRSWSRGPASRAMNCAKPLTSMLPPYLIRIGLAALLPLLLVAQYARAAEGDTLNVIAGVAVQHDDNIFRTSSNAKSDNTTRSTLGLKIDKRYSLQRFELEASLVDYHYSTFDELNVTARNHAAAWRWSLTPYLHGNLTSSRKETPNNSDSAGDISRNLSTDENQRFDGVLEVSGSWRVLGGVARSTRTNNSQFTPEEGILEEDDNRLNTAEAGLRYDFPSGSALSYIARNGRGKYLNQPGDNRFDQRENEIRLIWPVTGKSTVDLRAAHVERTRTNSGDDDYAGTVGHVNVNWKITDKTSLTAGLGRELSSNQAVTSSQIRADRFTLSPLWRISEKTSLRARYDHSRRDYRGADRVDTVRGALIALDWQALRTLTVSASLQNDRRTSNQPGLDYDRTIAGISALVSF